MQLNRGDTSFVSKGFSNWKDVTIGSRNHESSISHKEALQVSVLPNTCSDIGDMLSKQHAINNLLTLHVHKDHTDELDLMAVANEFVSHSEHRLSTFGKF